MRTAMTQTFWCAVAMACTLCVNVQATESAAATVYARNVLTKAGRNDVELREVKDLGHGEAFRVVKNGDKTIVEHQTSACQWPT